MSHVYPNKYYLACHGLLRGHNSGGMKWRRLGVPHADRLPDSPLDSLALVLFLFFVVPRLPAWEASGCTVGREAVLVGAGDGMGRGRRQDDGDAFRAPHEVEHQSLADHLGNCLHQDLPADRMPSRKDALPIWHWSGQKWVNFGAGEP
jgi:hypothetical protein